MKRDVAAGVFGGFALLALVNAVAIAVLVPWPTAGAPLRIADHVFDATETLGLGLASAVLIGAFMQLRVPRWGVYGLGFVVALAIVYAVIGDYLTLHATHARGGRFALPVLVNSLGLLSFSLVAAPVVGAYLVARPKLRFVPIVFAIAVLIVDQLILRDDYAGMHGLLALGAVGLAAPAFAPLILDAEQALSRRTRRVTLATIVLLSVAGLVVPPPNAVRHELFRQPCAVAPWVLATLVWRLPALHEASPSPTSPWMTDRTSSPPVPPTGPPLLPPDAVIVLVTIDALRADVVLPSTNDARFPTLAALKRDGVVFTHATTPGSQTPTSLATLFSGRYYSELRWADYGTGADRYPYPAADPSPRFPELLANHGVATANFAGYVFLSNPFGVVRGFREETRLGRSEAAASASRLTNAMLERLGRASDGPLFLYSHFAEPHAPYRLGPAGDDYHHYLSAVASADAEVARILSFLQKHMGRRWMLIVSADHGEAFGDHQTFEHAKTLYEELVHVPLLVRSPVLEPRRVDDRVGLVDLGPTLLDLFGVDTPATFDGQSLVPLLTGHPVSLTRPLISEGRLEVALTEQDGLKVIQDPRRKTVEVYDLARDPGETRNLFDVDPDRADPAVAWLRAFMAARTLHDGGYEPPYKP